MVAIFATIVNQRVWEGPGNPTLGSVNSTDERLSHDLVMRAIEDVKGLDRMAASTSQMGHLDKVKCPLFR